MICFPLFLLDDLQCMLRVFVDERVVFVVVIFTKNIQIFYLYRHEIDL